MLRINLLTIKLIVMADLGEKVATGKKSVGIKKPLRKLLRVDMTPMVDLGFILITFFVFTSTMSTSAAMNLYLPKDPEKTTDVMDIKHSGALTILLDNNTIYYYEGMFDGAETKIKSGNLSEIRDVILNKKKRTNADDFMVIVKPGSESTIGTLVNVLDEMSINVVKRYVMTDITDEESKLLAAL